MTRLRGGISRGATSGTSRPSSPPTRATRSPGPSLARAAPDPEPPNHRHRQRSRGPTAILLHLRHEPVDSRPPASPMGRRHRHPGRSREPAPATEARARNATLSRSGWRRDPRRMTRRCSTSSMTIVHSYWIPANRVSICPFYELQEVVPTFALSTARTWVNCGTRCAAVGQSESATPSSAGKTLRMGGAFLESERSQLIQRGWTREGDTWYPPDD